MKIGILTFQRALNYGAVLQCFALQETLKHQGHDVEIIDYRPWYIERYRQILPFKYINTFSGFMYKIRIVISRILKLKIIKKSTKSFDKFISNYLNISKKIISNNNFLCLNKYDVIIIGSDQVWNKHITFGYDSIYWGNFKNEHIKLITYAASLGEIDVYNNPTDINKINILIKNFDYLSSRELYTAEWIKNNFNRTCYNVLDPTLLLERNLYEKIAIRPSIKNYIFVFILDSTRREITFKFAKKLATKLNCTIVTLNAIGKTTIKNDIIYYGGLSPGEYLGLIKYAKCVIAISFHAIAFSIIFRNNFYSITNNAEGRVKNILNQIDLQERHIDPSKEIIFSSVNYTGIEEKLNKLKEDSLNYLKNSL